MPPDFKFVFFGTPEFAAIILQKLIDGGFIPIAVICNPDRPVGRKKIITPPLTKIKVETYGPEIKNKIKILQPEAIDSAFISGLQSLKPDFFIVAAYAQILPQKLLEIPRLGVIGVHPSLLPKHRGASPIQSAILHGDEETGVTLYLLDDKMDHGPILASRKVENYELRIMNYESLMKMLAETGGNLLVEILPKFLNGEVEPQPQDESKATYTKKFTANDAFIDEKIFEEALSGRDPETACHIERKIRALTPEPGVWTVRAGKRTKLLEAEIQNNALILKVIQTEGKRPEKIYIWQRAEN